MPRIEVLPHESLCPHGMVIDALPGDNLAQVILDAGIDLEHACGLVCACTTCHVVVKEGLSSLNEASDKEDDMLDRAWGLTPRSRLSCQVQIGSDALKIELPKYTINHAREEA